MQNNHVEINIFSSFLSGLITLSKSASSTGQVSAITFQQSPPQIVKEKTEVHIQCSHDDTSRPLMLWYQQRKDSRSMTLIVYGYSASSPTYEGLFKEQFTLTRKDSTSGTLTVNSANLSQCAVYFCAASAQ